MAVKLGVVMDPIDQIHYHKDSTLAMLWEASARHWDIFYMEPQDILLRDGTVFANSRRLKVYRDPARWFEKMDRHSIALSELDVILLRKDPPFNMEYIYLTYLLERAEQQGVRVVNKPQSVRDANEKLFTTWFPHCCPPTLVTRDIALLRLFLEEQNDIVCKPLDGMGGMSIFRVTHPDENASVIFETLTAQGTTTIMAQRYIPEIKQGDKRILMIDGEPVPYALARIPAAGELRGNLAAGGHGIAQPLSERDQWICQQVGPTLREKGLLFVGLDVIGDYLTEINVTSPTCIREIEQQTSTPVSRLLLDAIDEEEREAHLEGLN